MKNIKALALAALTAGTLGLGAAPAKADYAPAFALNAQAFQNYLNNDVTWDNGSYIRFQNIGNCSGGTNSLWFTCRAGFVTIKNPVEHKTCYVKSVSWKPYNNRVTYSIGDSWTSNCKTHYSF